jgi:transcriptional regulator with XRE-family HTH domain
MRTRFGENLRQARLVKGLSQESLADAAGLHRNEISLIERGAVEPRLSTVIILARGLEVPAAHLLEGLDGLGRRPSRARTERPGEA